MESKIIKLAFYRYDFWPYLTKIKTMRYFCSEMTDFRIETFFSHYQGHPKDLDLNFNNWESKSFSFWDLTKMGTVSQAD